MRARSYKPRKVNVVTLGCAKNIFDSEVMMAQLRANDFEVEHEAKQVQLKTESTIPKQHNQHA